MSKPALTREYLNKHGVRNIEHTVEMTFTRATDEELEAAGLQKAADLPDGFIAGWASTPGLDSYNHVVQGGAFDAAIKARGLLGSKGIQLLLDHDWRKPAGIITKLEYRGERLWLEAELELGATYVKDAYLVAKKRGGTNFSVGFMLQDYEFKEDPATKNEYLLIKRGDLYEVSVVPFPANEECTMEFIKSKLAPKELSSVAEFEKHLRDTGLVKSRDEARRITQVVKSCVALFSSPVVTAPVASDPAPIDSPLSGGVDLSKALAASAQLRKALAGS